MKVRLESRLLSTAFMTHLTVYAKAAKPMITQMFTRVLLMRPFCPSRVAPVTSPSLLLLFCDAVSCPSLISPLSLIFSWISCKVGHEHQIENKQQSKSCDYLHKVYGFTDVE
ncbi:hypothetical protein pdam_00003057, partial [Pocillopora damicornis]